MLKIIMNKLTNNTDSKVMSVPAAESTQGAHGNFLENALMYNIK